MFAKGSHAGNLLSWLVLYYPRIVMLTLKPLGVLGRDRRDWPNLVCNMLDLGDECQK